jgi:hypothetical protein
VVTLFVFFIVLIDAVAIFAVFLVFLTFVRIVSWLQSTLSLKLRLSSEAGLSLTHLIKSLAARSMIFIFKYFIFLISRVLIF